jgi:PAS domain S-box-containing protein
MEVGAHARPSSHERISTPRSTYPFHIVIRRSWIFLALIVILSFGSAAAEASSPRSLFRIAAIRDSYVFDNLVNASNFHAVVAPAIADLKIWLNEGVSGYDPQSPEVIGIAFDRIATAYAKAQQLNHDSQATAQMILDRQRHRLSRFLFHVNILFMLTILITAGMVFLLVRQGILERREIATRHERRQFEASLRESEARFREVVSNINEVIWLFDIESRRMIYVSPAYEKIWGRPIAGLVKRYDEWVASIHPEDREVAQKTFEEDIARGRGTPREYRIVRPEGTIRWILDRSFPIKNDEGRITRITGIAEDITERKEAEEALMASREKAARSRKMESLGLLAGGVAHDLNNIVLSVSDDGPGIASNDLARIFEPFYTKKAMGRSGTGLGLAVVWNVVQDHEGYINVTSDTLRTSFDLYFPITREDIAEHAPTLPLEALEGHGEKVLVIDDIATQGEIACGMLSRLGYRADFVTSGEEAVAYVKTYPVDLLVLDMIMVPGLSGRETYEQIVKILPHQKAIIVSGFAETSEVKKTQAMGAGQFLKKPLTLERLGTAVKRELSRTLV